MVYKELLLSAGGGIFDKDMLVEYSGKPTICIGLGGTGIDCLKQIKKQIYNRIKPDDTSSGEPIYKHVRFLAIDSDCYSIKDEHSFITIDKNTEYIDITSPLPKAAVLHKNPSLSWLSDKITLTNVNRSGTGGIRQIGRLLLMQKVSVVIQKIHDLIIQLLHEFNSNSINIHVITGMGGGTGSGVFLDVCYIIRHIIEELNLQRRAAVAGYFFLPDVYLERIYDGFVRRHIEINGFAAMKELDHCMNFDKNGGEWNQEYNNYKILSKHAPVDNAYLVSSIDIDGNIRTNGYKYAIDVVADYVTESLTHLFRLNPVMPPAYYPKKRTGACYNYYAIGGSRANVPYKDICTYLAARVFEAYQTLPSTNHDIDTFVSDNGLTYSNLLRELNKNVGIIPLGTLLGLGPGVIPSLLSKTSEALTSVEEAIKSNRLELEHSVITHIKYQLIKIATYRRKGPIYASLFLSNSDRCTKDLGNIIDGYIIENKERLLHARMDLTVLEDRVANALRVLQNTRIHRNAKVRDYISAVHSVYTQLAKIALYKEMETFLNKLNCGINDLYEAFFAPINVMLANVAETLDYNYKYLVETVGRENKYALKIIGLDDNVFKSSLDLAVESIDTARVVNDFVSYMIREAEELLNSNDDSKICAAVSSFFIQNFGEFMYKNIDCYLQEKFHVPTQNQLVDMLYNEIMIPLRDRAKPLFWTSELLDEAGRFDYCFIPNSSMIISEAASRMTQANSCFRINTSGSSDSISMFTLYCGVPMYMYRRIFDYKHQYNQSAIVGVHIYEGTELDPRDFRKLHNIIPLSLYSDDDLENVKDFICEYKRAVENGIIVKQGYDYQLRLADDEDFSSKKLRIKSMINNYSEPSRDNFKKHNEEYKDFIKDDNNTHVSFKNYINLPNSRATGYEDSVIRDHVFASEHYTSILYEQLAKIDELESLRLQLQTIFDNLYN